MDGGMGACCAYPRYRGYVSYIALLHPRYQGSPLRVTGNTLPSFQYLKESQDAFQRHLLNPSAAERKTAAVSVQEGAVGALEAPDGQGSRWKEVEIPELYGPDGLLCTASDSVGKVGDVHV